MTPSTAQLTNLRIAPRKVRLVADLLRGKTVARALTTLEHLPKRSATPLTKLIRSAVANAKGKGMSEPMVVKQITVDGGIVMKRFMPRARGSASQILKRTSTVRVTLAPSAPAKKEAKAETKKSTSASGETAATLSA